MGRRWRRHEHTVEHFLARSLLPGIEIGDLAVTPRQRIGEVGYQRVGIDRQIAAELILLALLCRESQPHEETCQEKEETLHIRSLFVRKVTTFSPNHKNSHKKFVTLQPE